MIIAFRQMRVYLRGTLILLIAGAIGLVLIKNRSHTVQFWFFGLTDDDKPINVVWLLLCTALATLVARWVWSLGWALWRDMREIKRRRAIAAASKALEHRATELEERERRIDQKLQRAVAQEEDTEEGARTTDA